MQINIFPSDIFWIFLSCFVALYVNYSDDVLSLLVLRLSFSAGSRMIQANKERTIAADQRTVAA